MIPDKYFKDLQNSNRKNELLSYLVLIFTFIFSFLILEPLIHEISHIFILELNDCSYSLNIFFSLPQGFRAEIKPLCAMVSTSLLIFYISGYLSTLVAGVLASIIGLETKLNQIKDFILAISSGILVSTILNLGVRGDIFNIMRILKLDLIYARLIILIVFLGTSSVLIKILEGIRFKTARTEHSKHHNNL